MACPFYRERWIGDGEVHEGRTVLYHVICLQNTPPATIDEQQDCLESRTMCWRLRAGRKRRVIIDDDDDDDLDDDEDESAPTATSAGQRVSV